MRVLVVCMWPLGGIRTYLKYNYAHFPADRFDVTVLANPAIEKDALRADMDKLGIRVEWAEPVAGRHLLSYRVVQSVLRRDYDLIHSQGFISAFHAALANYIFGLPHVATMHGVLEEKHFSGRWGSVKKAIFQFVIKRLDAFVGVGEDILNHVRNGLPKLQEQGPEWVVIRNGIAPERFLKDYPNARQDLQSELAVNENTFVFAYFGRFMPEKGFDYLIRAAKELEESNPQREWVVMAVGSGDYEAKYRNDVAALGLDQRFRFLPFRPDVAPLMQGCDLVVMPSVWEAYPLLTSEVLCCGTPIIATECPGLREAVDDTPAIVVPSKDAEALANAMRDALSNDQLAELFREFRKEAAVRFDVRQSAKQLMSLFERIVLHKGR